MGTFWAARFIGEEKNLGSIEKGKKADLVVLGADYLTVPEDQIGQIPVLTTIVGGKVVFDLERDGPAPVNDRRGQ